MQRCETIQDLRRNIAKAKAQGKTIGFAPTMGNLHAGHMQLVREAKQQTDVVVVSIFVNPTQFAPGEDFAAYPRTLQEDCALLQQQAVDVLFHPTAAQMYPSPARVQVCVPAIAKLLCGASRPGHFDGVGLVVTKLLHIVQPDVAFFGLKDYQQCLIIQRLVADLNFPLRLQMVPTVRESDGLAISSRNRYLLPTQRTVAPFLQQTLLSAQQRLLTGDRAYQQIEQTAADVLAEQGFDVEYFQIRRPDNLQPSAAEDQQWQVLVAARLGAARLIDNIRVAAE